jgi:F-type H+-transporting ATPase subunit alpha
VGGSAQVKAMKKVAGRLRLDLAQYRELEAFSAFGSDLDAASKAQLERGARLVELLKQAQYTPFPMEQEVVSVWAGTTGKLDEVPVEDIRRFESEFLEFLGRDGAGVLATIASSKDISDETVGLLERAMTTFKAQFTTSSGELLVKDEPVAALTEEDVDHEKITRRVRQA